MRAAEQLIEAVEYSVDENECWWEQFASPREARIILNQAQHSEVDEYEVIRLATALDLDSGYDLMTIYKECIATLKKQLPPIAYQA